MSSVDLAPPPVPSVPVPPAGWRSSEAWISFLAVVLGALPSSGLIDDTPLLAKIVGMAIAALATINYTAQRTALKRAYALGGSALTQAARSPQLATGLAIIVLALVVGLGQTACSSTATCKDPKNATSVGCVVEGAVVDCTGISSLPSAVAVVKPIVVKLFESATQPDGSIAWAGIEPSLVTLTVQYGTCVLAEIWNDYMNPPVAGSGSGSAAPRLVRAPLPADFAAEFDHIRAKTAPGRKIKTTSGAIL